MIDKLLSPFDHFHGHLCTCPLGSVVPSHIQDACKVFSFAIGMIPRYTLDDLDLSKPGPNRGLISHM